MLRPKRLLVDRQRPLVERLGLGVLALDAVKLRQVIEARGYQGVLRPKRLLQDRERAFVEWLGLAVAALGVIDQRQVVETSGEAYVIRPKRFRLLQRGL